MITQERLKEVLKYNSETGEFTRKIAKGGKIKDSSGYILISVDGEKYYAHRLAWLYMYGEFPKNSIDHINKIKDDNHLYNLRDVTSIENQRNRFLNINNKSGFLGVSWYKPLSKW